MGLSSWTLQTDEGSSLAKDFLTNTGCLLTTAYITKHILKISTDRVKANLLL